MMKAFIKAIFAGFALLALVLSSCAGTRGETSTINDPTTPCAQCKEGYGGLSISIVSGPPLLIKRAWLTIDTTPEYSSAFEITMDIFTNQTFLDIPEGSDLNLLIEVQPAEGDPDPDMVIYRITRKINIVAGQVTTINDLKLLKVMGPVVISADYPLDDYMIANVDKVKAIISGNRIPNPLTFYLKKPNDAVPRVSESQDSSSAFGAIIVPVGTERTINIEAYDADSNIIFTGYLDYVTVDEGEPPTQFISLVNVSSEGRTELTANSCTPDCGAKICGGDGCGGTCGGCAAMQTCNNGMCACSDMQQGVHMVCWGTNDCGQATPQIGLYKKISSRAKHTCGINLSDDYVSCWGCSGSDFGQCNFPPDTPVKQVSAGLYHTCAIDSYNVAVCWGCNSPYDYGQCGVIADYYKQVAAGRYHTCAIKSDNTAVCWGCQNTGDYGQCSAPADKFKSIVVGDYHTCGIREDGTVICWGCGINYEQCNNSSYSWIQFKALTAGMTHTCGIDFNGYLYCWGCNGDDRGQCGGLLGLKLTKLATGLGSYTSCGLTPNGRILCWGEKSEMGEGNPPDGIDAIFGDIDLGDVSGCALKSTPTCP